MDSALVFDFIEISGLMSFPPHTPQKLILNTYKLTTIIGENLDVGGGERNGVGKSAIIDALLYLYLGRSPRVPNQALVNYVMPGPLYVTGEARRGDVAFRVERGDNPSLLRLYERPADDPRDFHTKESGKPIFDTTKSTKPETTKRIIELLGFDLKLADVLLVATPSDKSCFFLKSEEEQRTIVERIFGFTVFTEKADRLRELRKEEQKNLNTKESALIATKQANDRILNEIAALETKSNAWAAERDRYNQFVVQQINSYKPVNFEHEIEVLTRRQNLATDLSKAEQELQTHTSSRIATTKRLAEWETQHQQLIDKIKETIDTNEKIDPAVIELIKQRLKTELDINTLMMDMDAATRERQPYQQAIQDASTQKSRVTNQIEATEAQIFQLNESKCPTCGQDWGDTKAHTLKCVAELDALNAERTALDATMAQVRTKVKAIDGHVEKLRMALNGLSHQLGAFPETAFISIEEATRASTSLKEQRQRLTEAQAEVNPHAASLEELATIIASCEARCGQLKQEMQGLPETQFKTLSEAVEAERQYQNLNTEFAELQHQENPFRDTIDSLRDKAMKPVDEGEISQLRRRIDHMSLLITLLADRDSPIRKAVLNEWIPELNSRVNDYLEFLELGHRISFDADMTATFTIDGKTCGFGNLSTGQRLRVWLATNRAFREIFELINYPISTFFVDELLDKGMSARGAEVSYRLLEQMVDEGRSVFLITHRNELVDMATETLTISFENGLSTIDMPNRHH